MELFLTALGFAMVLGVMFICLFHMCKNRPDWVFYVMYITFGLGFVLYTINLGSKSYYDGAMDIVRGKLESHYVYTHKDSVCVKVDTSIEFKKK